MTEKKWWNPDPAKVAKTLDEYLTSHAERRPEVNKTLKRLNSKVFVPVPEWPPLHQDEPWRRIIACVLRSDLNLSRIVRDYIAHVFETELEPPTRHVRGQSPKSTSDLFEEVARILKSAREIKKFRAPNGSPTWHEKIAIQAGTNVNQVKRTLGTIKDRWEILDTYDENGKPNGKERVLFPGGPAVQGVFDENGTLIHIKIHGRFHFKGRKQKTKPTKSSKRNPRKPARDK